MDGTGQRQSGSSRARVARAAGESLPDAWVLLVEDDQNLQDVLILLLESDGFAVARALDGRDALALLRGALRPCAIVIDYHLPSLDAGAFRAEQLATNLQLDVPVIVISGDERVDAGALSAETVLRKPFGYEELRGALQRVCAPEALTAADGALSRSSYSSCT